jgi:NAD(P)-dependent dehydrogenase (short-subunit alcohol dehydrogenase family)
MSKPLHGKIALVAGATRGAGRGIAIELALAGATVYCTGRSSSADPHRSPRATSRDPFALESRPETIEETAAIIGAAGGSAIAIRTDHSDEGEVRALCERIAGEHGRLDVLVNDIWGGDELSEWGKAFWELDLDKGFRMLARAINTHVVTSRYAIPLMLAGQGGLIVEVTDGGAMHYRGNAFYDLAKSGVTRLAFGLAEELRERTIAVVAVSPGFLRSEAMLEHFGVEEANWRDAVKTDPHFANSETPRYVGRAIAALAGDPDVRGKSGRGYGSWQLQVEYGFTDLDGATPNWGAHARQHEFGIKQAASNQRFLRMFVAGTT